MKMYPYIYFRQASSGDTLQKPDPALAGKFYSILEILYNNSSFAHNKADKSHAVKSAIDALEPVYPDLIEELMALSEVPAEVNVLGFGMGWALIHSSDLDKLPPIEYLIDAKIPKRGLSIIYGKSGTFKTFLALNYALNIAQSAKVIYMAGEDEAGYIGRVRAWEVHNQKTRANLYLSLGAVPVLDDVQLRAFIELIKGLNPALVVVDTLARAMLGGDENSSRDMGYFIRACNKISRSSGCSVLLVHHTNKNSDDERGSSALRGGADSMIKVTALDNTIEVESSKSKNAQPFETEFYTFVQLPETGSGVLVESSRIALPTCVKSVSELTQSQMKIIRAMCEYLDGEATAQEAADMVSIPRPSVQRVFKDLKRLGLVDQANKREPYRATELAYSLLGLDSHVSHVSVESRKNTKPAKINDSSVTSDTSDTTDRI